MDVTYPDLYHIFNVPDVSCGDFHMGVALMASQPACSYRKDLSKGVGRAAQVYIGSDKVALEALEGGLDGNVSSAGGCAIVSAALAMVDVSSWSASLHASPCFLGGILG
jgi:hypothetical protein